MDEVGRLELIREALIAVTQEMRANVIHSSYSSIIYEGHDFSTALVGPDGRYVAQCDGDHPLHVFSVPYSTRIARHLVCIFPLGWRRGPMWHPTDDTRAQWGRDSPGKRSLIPSTSQLPGGRQQTRVVLSRG